MAESPNISLDQSIRQRKYSSLSQYGINPDSTAEKTEHKQPEQNVSKKQQYASTPLELYKPGGDVRSEQPVTRGINIDIVI